MVGRTEMKRDEDRQEGEEDQQQVASPGGHRETVASPEVRSPSGHRLAAAGISKVRAKALRRSASSTVLMTR